MFKKIIIGLSVVLLTLQFINPYGASADEGGSSLDCDRVSLSELTGLIESLHTEFANKFNDLNRAVQDLKAQIEKDKKDFTYDPTGARAKRLKSNEAKLNNFGKDHPEFFLYYAVERALNQSAGIAAQGSEEAGRGNNDKAAGWIEQLIDSLGADKFSSALVETLSQYNISDLAPYKAELDKLQNKLAEITRCLEAKLTGLCISRSREPVIAPATEPEEKMTPEENDEILNRHIGNLNNLINKLLAGQPQNGLRKIVSDLEAARDATDIPSELDQLDIIIKDLKVISGLNEAVRGDSKINEVFEREGVASQLHNAWTQFFAGLKNLYDKDKNVYDDVVYYARNAQDELIKKKPRLSAADSGAGTICSNRSGVGRFDCLDARLVYWTGYSWEGAPNECGNDGCVYRCENGALSGAPSQFCGASYSSAAASVLGGSSNVSVSACANISKIRSGLIARFHGREFAANLLKALISARVRMLTGTQIYTTNFSRPRARENGDRAAQMLVDGNMVTTATKGTLVTQMFVPNVKTSVQPPPPSRVERTLQVLLRSLKRKIAIEFGGIPHPTPADTAKINLWDYEITLILASGEEIDDSFSLVGDGIAKETDLFMARVGKDGNIYFDVTRDDFSELLQFVEFKIRIKKGDRVKENSQAVFRNPRYDIPHEPEPFVSPPF